MTAPEPTCRSASPDGDGCTKERGHRRRWHQRGGAHGIPSSRRWEGGINTEARWEEVDDGYMTDGEWLAYGRRGF